MSSILIAGGGAVGSVFAAALRAAGHPVTILGRRAHLEAIAHHGLKMTGLFGERIARGFELVENVSQLQHRYELVMLAVKSYDTAATADSLKELLAPDGMIVSLQNGLGNIEMLIERFGAERVLGGRVIFGAHLTAAGITHVTVMAQPVALGPAPALNGAASEELYRRAVELARRCTQAGVPTEAVTDIMPVLWTKVLYNIALNPLGALLKLHYGALAEDPDLRQIMEAAVREAFAVAQRLEIELPVPDAEAYLKLFYEKLIPPTFDHRPSMLHDLEYRGRTEISALNGKVVELANTLGFEAPVNRTLTSLIRASERLRQAAIRREQV